MVVKVSSVEYTTYYTSSSDKAKYLTLRLYFHSSGLWK